MPYRQFILPPAVVESEAVKGRRMDGGTILTLGALIVSNAYGIPMQRMVAKLALIHHDTTTTVSYLLLQSRTIVQAVVWIMVVQVMDIDAK